MKIDLIAFYTLFPGRDCSIEDHAAISRRLCVHKYSSLYIARFSFIQPSKLEQCRVKKTSLTFSTAAHDSKPDPLSRKSDALPLSHCVISVSVNLRYVCKSEPKTAPRVVEVCRQRRRTETRDTTRPDIDVLNRDNAN